MTEFRVLAADGDLDAQLAASHVAPVIVFKHSETCGVSHMARELLTDGDLPAVVHEIVVQRQRALSNRVASLLGVRHESPQVLVIARGTAAWHSSHSGVIPARVATAWAKASADFTPAPVDGAR